ncbi:MAG: amino acid permease [Flavobacteriaceae bacterium]
MSGNNTVGWKTATAIVIANMIGAGIFTSLGFQLVETVNTWSIIILWSLGALMALCGALSYAELGTHWRRSGGEYHFLSQAFHPMIGYLSGWVSLTVGFAAPVALAAMALSDYVGPYLSLDKLVLALFVIILISGFHSLSLKRSSLLQNTTTILKLALILVLLYYGFARPATDSAFLWDGSWQDEVYLPAFAVSFVFVTFSYSGWNAAAYIVDEIKDVNRSLPRALIAGTLVVSLLYICLNLIFLKHNGLAQIQGELEIGQITAISLFGETGGKLMSFGIALLLISSISAMVWAGPRVTQVMGEDHRLWRWFSVKSSRGIPLRAIWLQAFISIAMVLTGSFEQVIIYSGFILQLFSALAVAAVFVIRSRGKDHIGFRSPFYPLPQLIFLFFSGWVLVYLIMAQPLETGLGLINILIGFLLFRLNKAGFLKK